MSCSVFQRIRNCLGKYRLRFSPEKSISGIAQLSTDRFLTDPLTYWTDIGLSQQVPDQTFIQSSIGRTRCFNGTLYFKRFTKTKTGLKNKQTKHVHLLTLFLILFFSESAISGNLEFFFCSPWNASWGSGADIATTTDLSVPLAGSTWPHHREDDGVGREGGRR